MNRQMWVLIALIAMAAVAPTARGVAPTIAQQPTDQVACAGDFANFSITATGTAPLSYQWRRGTTNLINGAEGRFWGTRTAGLLIMSPVAGDVRTDYNCVVSNGDGSVTSNDAALSLIDAVVISAQPSDQGAFPGGSASFTVAGTGQPTYQWRRGTTNLVDGGNISGATTATLTIDPAGTADAADDYNCVLTNGCGSVGSDNVTLYVPPLMDVLLEFNCHKSTTGPADIGWSSGTATLVSMSGGASSDQDPLAPDGSAHLIAPSVLIIGTSYPKPAGAPVTLHVHIGGHSTPSASWGWGLKRGSTTLCSATGYGGGDGSFDNNVTVYAGEQLTVSGNAAASGTELWSASFAATCWADPTAASLSAQPVDQFVCSGGTVNLAVIGAGTPALTYQWRRGTTNLPNNDPRILGTRSATLTILNAELNDVAADYNCVVTNHFGSATSNNAALSLGAGPGISAQPADQALVLGGDATFTVTADGSPAPTYQWRKDTVPLTDDGRISGSETATLTINSLAATDRGRYDVVVTNSCGAVTSTVAPLWQRGDTNCDGIVNYADINPFVLALGGGRPGYEAQFPYCWFFNADASNDNVVNYADINAFVILLNHGS